MTSSDSTRSAGMLAAGALAGTLLLTDPVSAQRASPRDPFRLSGAVGVDLGGVPDAFTSRCGRGGGTNPGWGAAGALRWRPRSWLVTQGDARYVIGDPGSSYGCNTDLPIAIIPPDTIETRPGADYARGTPGVPHVAVALRVGVETPPSAPRLVPLLRATIGGGTILGGADVLPLGLVSISMGTRGPRARGFLEVERGVTRVAATERRERYVRQFVRPPVRVDTVALTFRPMWMTVRLGVEFPFGPRR